MLNNQDFLVWEEKYNDLRREAEQQRTRKLLVGRQRRTLFTPLLAWLGNRLVRWGRQLQQQHGPISTTFQKPLAR